MFVQLCVSMITLTILKPNKEKRCRKVKKNELNQNEALNGSFNIQGFCEMIEKELTPLAPVPALIYICRKFYKKTGACNISNPDETINCFHLIKPY